MAGYKFTVKRGALNRKDVVVASGSSEAQGETLSVNIDASTNTSLGKRDICDMLDAVKAKVMSGPWPPL